MKKKNVMLIMTDQQRYDTLGCYGNDIVSTPNLDSIADDGILFENAYSPCPACIPARGCLLTGLSPYNCGSITYEAELAPHFNVTVPKLLKECGYNTVAVGKNHFQPQRALHGYDKAIIDESGRIESEDFESDYMAWFENQTNSKELIPDYADYNGYEGYYWQLDEKLHPTVWTANTALKELDELAKKDEPFFLKVSFARPHSPYDAPKRLYDYYYNKNLKMPPKAPWSKPYEEIKGGKTRWQGLTTQEEDQRTRAGYLGNVTFIDEEIGKIIGYLKEHDLYDNTMIIFTADHGDMLGDHNLWRKCLAYEGSIHIPLLIKTFKDFDIKVSRRQDPATLVDILPTIMGTTDYDGSYYTDGIDLLNQKNDYIHGEYVMGYEEHFDNQFISDGKYKCIWYLRTGEIQLFDIQNDNDEMLDLAKNPVYKEICVKFCNLFKIEMEKRNIDINTQFENGFFEKYPDKLPYGIYGIFGDKRPESV